MNPNSHSFAVAVAPMMAYTDTHCRTLLRLASPSVTLFTEMVTTGALLHGQTERLLRFNPIEQPLVLQLGGNDPTDLARCTELAAAAGFVEVNLNVGCPSERVQSGAIGACLMKQPSRVADMVGAMKQASSLPVTVKCRLGLDRDETTALLYRFVSELSDVGCERFYIHARNAILSGLTPAQNRSVPALRPQEVTRLKQNFPQLEIMLNGGLSSVEQVFNEARQPGLDGAMIGRAAVQNPRLLAQLHQALHDPNWCFDDVAILNAYVPYARQALAANERPVAVFKPLLGLFNGRHGARRYRALLTHPHRVKQEPLAVLQEAIAWADRSRAA